MGTLSHSAAEAALNHGSLMATNGSLPVQEQPRLGYLSGKGTCVRCEPDLDEKALW
jgi:hypothetical protein